MKIISTRILILALFLTFSSKILAHVELDYPVGGETLTAGQQITIRWHVAIAHNTLNWDLYYSPDAGANWEPIETNIPPAQLTYAWTVPNEATTQARIRVYQNNSAADYLDISGDFTIQQVSLAPTIEITAKDTSIECSAANQQSAIQTWLNNHGGAFVNTSCNDLAWTHNYTALSNGCGSTGNALVTFTATDQCGSTWTSAYIEIVDNVLPVLNTAALDKVVEVGDPGNTTTLNQWLSAHGGAQASDACSNVNWINDFTNLSNGCGVTGDAQVHFTATDECGNFITTSARFTIEDTVAPNIDVPAQSTIIECGLANQQSVIQNWLQNHGGAHAVDNGGNFTWTNNFPTVPDTCGTTLHLSITFTATDDCGNSSTTAAIFTINAAPTATIDATGANFKIYPNPASEKINITFSSPTTDAREIQLLDSYGKSLLKMQGNSDTMDLPVIGISPGIYFVKISTQNGSLIRKIIIE